MECIFFYILLESTIIEQGTKEAKKRYQTEKCKGKLKPVALQKSRNWNINRQKKTDKTGRSEKRKACDESDEK